MKWPLLLDQQARTGVLFVAPAVLFLLVFVTYPVFDVFRLSLFAIDFATDQEQVRRAGQFRAHAARPEARARRAGTP